MSLRKKHNEIARLREAFDAEAQKFHNLRFSIHYVTQDRPVQNKIFDPQNHCIMLWQYYGNVSPAKDVLLKNLEESNLQWGIRGAALSAFGVLEGEAVNLFVRMAKRAGNLFNDKEASFVKSRVVDELIEKTEKKEDEKPTFAVNDNVLAIWLNYILYHMSLDNPNRSRIARIEPDPFSLSLLALEHLLEDPNIGKIDKSITKIEDIKFRVALSFPGEKRSYVTQVAQSLRSQLGKDSLFYDLDYQSQLARPDLDTLLQKIYRNNSELIVVFLCSEYADKEWSGLEWRAIRDIIKLKENDRIMFVRFDDANVEGVFSIDGYIDATKFNPSEIADFIMERVNLIIENA